MRVTLREGLEIYESYNAVNIKTHLSQHDYDRLQFCVSLYSYPTPIFPIGPRKMIATLFQFIGIREVDKLESKK